MSQVSIKPVDNGVLSVGSLVDAFRSATTPEAAAQAGIPREALHGLDVALKMVGVPAPGDDCGCSVRCASQRSRVGKEWESVLWACHVTLHLALVGFSST
jgi:hypothetical protein